MKKNSLYAYIGRNYFPIFALQQFYLAERIHASNHVAKHFLLFGCELCNKTHHAACLEIWNSEGLTQLLILINNSRPWKQVDHTVNISINICTHLHLHKKQIKSVSLKQEQLLMIMTEFRLDRCRPHLLES